MPAKQIIVPLGETTPEGAEKVYAFYVQELTLDISGGYNVETLISSNTGAYKLVGTDNIVTQNKVQGDRQGGLVSDVFLLGVTEGNKGDSAAVHYTNTYEQKDTADVIVVKTLRGLSSKAFDFEIFKWENEKYTPCTPDEWEKSQFTLKPTSAEPKGVLFRLPVGKYLIREISNGPSGSVEVRGFSRTTTVAEKGVSEAPIAAMEIEFEIKNSIDDVRIDFLNAYADESTPERIPLAPSPEEEIPLGPPMTGREKDSSTAALLLAIGFLAALLVTPLRRKRIH